jgi:hypothetical protein
MPDVSDFYLIVARQVFSSSNIGRKERIFVIIMFLYVAGSAFVQKNDKRDAMVNLVSITFFIFARLFILS